MQLVLKKGHHHKAKNESIHWPLQLQNSKKLVRLNDKGYLLTKSIREWNKEMIYNVVAERQLQIDAV
jgi:hypothetical protein